MGEAKNTVHDMFDMMAIQSSDPLSLEEREAMFNVNQRRIYDNLHTHQKRHEVGECLCNFNRFPCLSVEWVRQANHS